MIKLQKKKILLKDTFLMFQLIDSKSYNHIDESIAYFESNYKTIYDDEKIEEGPLKIEKCELGKNIDIKFKEFMKVNLILEEQLKNFIVFLQIMEI